MVPWPRGGAICIFLSDVGLVQKGPIPHEVEDLLTGIALGLCFLDQFREISGQRLAGFLHKRRAIGRIAIGQLPLRSKSGAERLHSATHTSVKDATRVAATIGVVRGVIARGADF